MPFAFAYMTAAFLYAALALVALLAAALMSVRASLRPWARWLSLGTLGSVPGTLIFQALALPFLWVVAMALALFHFFHGEAQLTNPFAIWVTIGAVLLMFVSFASASLYGFVFGWRTANELWSGARLKTLIAADPVGRRLAKYRAPLLLGLFLVESINGALAFRWWLISGIAVDDAIGTYRTTNTSAQAVLEIRADRTWTYRLAAQPEFHGSGSWTLEPLSTPSEVVICLNHFELGFARYPGDIPRGPSFFMSYFSRTFSGGIRWCLSPDGGEACFERLPP